MNGPNKTALLVGGSRGLGLGLVESLLARGWDVLATVRNDVTHSAFQEAPNRGNLSVMRLDMNSPNEIAALAEQLRGRQLDLLFVSAGIASDPASAVEAVPTEDFVRVMVTNALSPLRVIGTFHRQVKPDGVIAAMSSNMGSVSGNFGGGWEVYRASKAALNQLMKSFAARQKDQRTYLVVSPGWVRTDMGGESAPLDIRASAEGIVDTIESRWRLGGVHFVDYQNNIVPW